MKPTAEQVQAAIAALPQSDITEGGYAKMRPLNKLLKSQGFDAISALERDAAMMAPLEEADTAGRRVTLTGSASNPMRIYVHGIGQFEIRIGETKTLPSEAIEAMAATDATFEVEE